MRRIFRTRRPTNFKLGRRTKPGFAKVTILISFYLEQPSATNQNTQQHEASRGLSAIAELLILTETLRENGFKLSSQNFQNRLPVPVVSAIVQPHKIVQAYIICGG